ncbi:MAG: V-type ATPase subunit [Candidatus Woesearchaeota archaeon]
MVRTEFNSKVRLGFSPYTYARVAVMKSFLFKQGDYDKILKMGANEALRFLQDTHYKKEMDDFDVSSEGIKNIEAALNVNLMRNFTKLHRISDKNMQKVIAIYLLRYDLENIKMILRSKFAKINMEEVEPLLYSSVNFTKDFMKILLSKNSVEEVVNSLDFLKKQKPGNNLFEVENTLDKYYLETLYDFSKNLKGQGKLVAKFLQYEIGAVNIKTIIKLKNADVLKGDINKYLVYPSKLVMKLSTLGSIPEMIKLLHRNKYTTLTGEEKDLLTKLEIDLDVSLLKKETLLVHQSLLSANYILGYLFAKEIEVRNLKALVKGKKLGVSGEYLEQLLVIAK